MNGEEHGTRSGYSKGCRCDECRAASASRHRAWTAKVKGRPPETVEHGASCYANWGCRCDVCSKADRALKREIAKRERDANPELVRARARRKYQRSHARQLERATRYRYPWTGPELELAARPDLSHAQVAEMIGRTGAAVKHMRRKLQYDPKIINLAGVASDHRA